MKKFCIGLFMILATFVITLNLIGKFGFEYIMQFHDKSVGIVIMCGITIIYLLCKEIKEMLRNKKNITELTIDNE